MRPGPAGAALLVGVLVLAAGCSGAPKLEPLAETVEVDASAAQANRSLTALEGRLGMAVVPATRGTAQDWYVLPGHAAATGALRAFRWTIPDGALVQDPFGTTTALHFELAPIDVTPTPLGAWGVFLFLASGGNATYLDAAWDLPRVVDVMGPVGVTTVEEPLSVAPRLWSVSSTDWAPGAQLVLVVGATSDEPTDFALAFRLLDHAPQPNEAAAPSLESFVSLRSETSPLALLPSGEGAGLHLAGYESQTVLSVSGDLSVVVRNTTRHGPIVVTERLPVPENAAVTARQTTFSSAFDTPMGWSRVQGQFVGACATGTWSALSDLHGHRFEARSVVLQHLCAALYPYIAEIIVFGGPSYIHSAEGPAAAAATFELLVVDANALEATTFQHIGFGTTIRDLTGLTATSVDVATTGLAGNVPPDR